MLQNLKGGRPLPVVDSIGPASVKIIEQVLFAPMRPSGMPKFVTVILAFFMAIFLGVMLAFVFEYMDQSFKSPQEVENFLNLPYLGAIPKNAKPELYHALADQIYLLLRDKNIKTIQFFSALEQEGVTNTIANLAGYYAKMGHKVLIIDANLRNSAINKHFRIPESQGLADILESKLTFDKAIKQAVPNLDVITAGKTNMNPITLLDSTTMQDVLKVAKDRYEIVLVDIPCLREYKDAAILSSKVDGNCLIVTEGVTRKQVVLAALDSVVEKKSNILGVVLNNRSFELPKVIYDIA
jgi:capsular exopolysaccharide synthesis family protein